MTAVVRPRSIRMSRRANLRTASITAPNAAGFLALAVAFVLVSIQPAQANPIVYIETGTLTGTIGATSFTDAAVTLTTVADTSNIVLTNIDGYNIYENAGTTTIQIAGVGTATFNGGDSFGAFSEDLTSVFAGTGNVGIADISQQVAIFGNFTTIPPFYDLSTSFTSTGTSSYNSNSFSTTLGDLTIGSTSGNATFTATAVPEPATIVSAVFPCLLACAWMLARRVHRAA